MNFKVTVISPAIALDMLSRNNSNRKISASIVKSYAEDMVKGNWKENTAEPIKISKEGRLLDGQHRLSAVVRACKPISFVIAYDLEDSIFSYLDTGKKRNGGDVLTILGTDNATMKAAGIASWWVISNGRSIRVDGGNVGHRNDGLTNLGIMNEYLRRQEFWDNLTKRANRHYTAFRKILTTSYILGWSAKLSEIDEAKSIEFMDKLCTGLNLNSDTDPIHQLRSTFISAKANSIRKLDNKYRNALMVKAWNLFYTNSQVRFLNWNANTEGFPVLITKPLFQSEVHLATTQDENVNKEETTEA